MSRLKSETNSAAMQVRVRAAFMASGLCLASMEADPVFEHGQWWVTCNACGAQWSVNDATGGDAIDGFSFEQVSEGDGYCTADAESIDAARDDDERP